MKYKTRNQINRTDLELVRRFRQEYEMALAREDYDTALSMVNAIDQVFYERGIDLVKLLEDDKFLNEANRNSRVTDR
jgi:hypothetical protein